VAGLLDTVFSPAKVEARARELAATIRPDAVGKDPAAAKAFDAAVARFQEAVASRSRFIADELKTSASE